MWATHWDYSKASLEMILESTCYRTLTKGAKGKASAAFILGLSKFFYVGGCGITQHDGDVEKLIPYLEYREITRVVYWGSLE